MPLKCICAPIPTEKQQAIIKKHDIEGLCCAYALSFLEMCLRGRPHDGIGPALALKINAIAELQSDGVHDSWVKGGSQVEHTARQVGLDPARLKGAASDDQDLPPGVYYISVEFNKVSAKVQKAWSKDRRYKPRAASAHGFGVDFRAPGKFVLADAGAGIYTCDGMGQSEVLSEHLELFETAGLLVTSAKIYKMSLAQQST